MRLSNPARFLDLGLCLWLGCAGMSGGARAEELMTDPGFTRGVRVIAPGNPREEQGWLQPPGAVSAAPAWRLVQWTSRQSIAGAAPESRAEGVRFRNDAKSVCFHRPAHEGGAVDLAMWGTWEYGARPRQPEEPWPHLLVEQEIARPPALSELAGLQFRLTYRLKRSETNVPARLEAWHCAQFQAFLIIQNRREGSPGYGDFLWFGIPMFDSRYRQPMAHAARDTAGSDKFIYTPAGRVYTDRAAADGDWIALDRDVLPLIREGLERAWREGFLTRSRDLADFRVTGMNLGWELTGPLDVEMQFRGLGLTAGRSQATHSVGRASDRSE